LSNDEAKSRGSQFRYLKNPQS